MTLSTPFNASVPLFTHWCGMDNSDPMGEVEGDIPGDTQWD